jgi:hypothetical protein
VAVCTRCGDGICDAYENACTCPADCPVPDAAIAPPCVVPDAPVASDDGCAIEVGIDTTVCSGGFPCVPLCASSAYPLSCTTSSISSPSPPSPASSLGCEIVPISQPENAQLYCCPCGG